MKIHFIVFLGFAILVGVSSSCQTQQSNGPANSPMTTTTHRTTYGINANEVFASIRTDGVSNAVVVAHTSAFGQVVVSGRCGEKHVAAVASRDPYYSEEHPWQVCYLQVMTTDRICLWFYAKEKYDHTPTEEDIADLLKRVHSRQTIDDFIFEEKVR